MSIFLSMTAVILQVIRIGITNVSLRLLQHPGTDPVVNSDEKPDEFL